MMSISKLQKKIFKTVVPIVVICMLSIGMLAGCSEEKSEVTKTSNKTAEEVTSSRTTTGTLVVSR